MLSGRGERLLFADADGASKFSDFNKLDASLNNIYDKEVILIYYFIIYLL